MRTHSSENFDAASVLDLTDPAVVADPYPAFAALRRQAPVSWHSGLGLYIAADHASAGAVLRARSLGRIFRPRPGDDWDIFNWLHADSILDSEPPKHTRLRRLVSGVFTRGRVQALAPRIAALTDSLLDDGAAELADRGELDVIAAYAEPLPVLVIAELLGVPTADRVLLRDWSQDIVRMYEPDPPEVAQQAARRASREFADYIDDHARQRDRAPGDDLLSALVQASADGDRLSPTELVATAVLLLNAGHEASVNGFGNGLVSWLEAAGSVALPADPSAVEPLVEEMLRHDSPLQLFERTATADTEIGGVTIRPGEKIAALLGAANRDPAVFDQPDVFAHPGAPVFPRNPNPHLAFGAGIHFCIGAPLARLELQISVPALLRRFGPLQLVSADQRDTFVLRGFHSVLVAPAG